MEKVILTNSGEVLLSTEEMLLSFNNMLKKFAGECVRGLSGITGNVDEFEDYYQIATIEAINAFKSYNIENGVMFSTYLNKSLRYVFIHLLRDKSAKIRKPEQPLLYINKKANNDENNTEDGINVLVNDYDVAEEVIKKDEDLEDFLMKNLTKEEMILLTMGMYKKMSKAKTLQKSSLNFMVSVLMENSGEELIKTKAELAKTLNISRPTLNKNIDKSLEKIKILAKEFINTKEIGEIY